MKSLILISVLVFSFCSVSQSDSLKFKFNQFLVENELPGCFQGFDSNTTDFTWQENSFTIGTNIINSEYNQELEHLKLYITETCIEKNVLELKYLKKDSSEYLLVYEETDDHCCSYGELTKYVWKDSTWIKGNALNMSWENIFQLENKEMQSLKSTGEMPAVMFTFKEEGLYVEIPWEYYSLTFDEDTNGYLQGGAMKPFTISYSEIVKN